MLDLARAEEEALRAASREEAVRLALWRLDTAVAPLIARESARPHFVYESFYPDFRVRSLTSSELPKDRSLVATPLLTETAPFVRLHFQVDPGGEIGSPQVPTQAWEADGANLPPEADGDALAAWSAQLDELRKLDTIAGLATDLDAVADAGATPLSAPARTHTQVITEKLPPKQQPVEKKIEGKALLAEEGWSQQGMQKRAAFNEDQQARNFQEFTQRVNTSNANVMVQQKTVATYLPASELATGVMQPLWIGGELLLARSVILDGAAHVQGCWLDWPGLEASLLAEVTDLLPDARLAAVDPAGDGDPSRRLAALPRGCSPASRPAPPRRPRRRCPRCWWWPGSAYWWPPPRWPPCCWG